MSYLFAKHGVLSLQIAPSLQGEDQNLEIEFF